jgi:hypothetical protein
MDVLKRESFKADGERGKGGQDGEDLRPEYCQYRDEGCEHAPSCLECPFPNCFYDEPGGRQKWLRELRNSEINRLFRGGDKVEELAMKFDVSERTVQRALKRGEREKSATF